jgi:hypothetical protein
MSAKISTAVVTIPRISICSASIVIVPRPFGIDVARSVLEGVPRSKLPIPLYKLFGFVIRNPILRRKVRGPALELLANAPGCLRRSDAVASRLPPARSAHAARVLLPPAPRFRASPKRPPARGASRFGACRAAICCGGVLQSGGIFLQTIVSERDRPMKTIALISKY